MCSGSDDSDADKLREFQQMQRMHRQQTEETENSINQSAGDFPSSISKGLHLPLGQQQSLYVSCSSLPFYSAAGSVHATSARTGPVMASCSTSFDPRPSARLSPCLKPESSLEEPSLLGSRVLPSHSPLHTQIQLGGCGPPPAGPPFPRPMPQMTGSFPGYRIQSSHPSCTTVATSTTPSVNAVSPSSVCTHVRVPS